MIFTNDMTKRKKIKYLENKINYKKQENIKIIDISNNDKSTYSKPLFNNLNTNNKKYTNLLNNLTNVSNSNNISNSTNVFLQLNTNISNKISNTDIINNVKNNENDPTFGLLKNDDINNTNNSNIEIKIINNDKLHYIKTNIHKIVNVYQETYNNNKKATGLGDFIRGSIYLIQFCNKYNINYDIDISNHPISNYLNITPSNKKYLINSFDNNNCIRIISENNIILPKTGDDIDAYFIDYLYEQIIINNTILIYTIAYPEFTSNDKEKEFIRSYFKPNNNIENLFDFTLSKLKLTKNNYTVIHIRSGDNLLVNNQNNIDKQIIFNIIKECNLFFDINKNTNYLLLADSNYIKYIIIKQFPFIKSVFNEITHLGEGVKLTNETVKNTMLDFYLIANSFNVFAMSVYQHGSGFSKWTSEIYNIPYICKYIG
jgi:hypothetical protein